MPKYVVRHGVMRHLGVFSTRGGDAYGRGTQVIARTNRGLELGEVLCEATEHALANMDAPKSGQILREQSEDDAGELRRLLEQQHEEHTICEKCIAELQLDMRLIDVEHLYGGERVVVYYLSEERVDFRQLVKNLASEFQTRIEMCQIGVRDEAKLLADYGDCGKPVCCNTHLSEMPPVSMRMAKLQKATLDPSKISGRCGRLKCCLRYEYDTYQVLQKDLPPIGSEIITGDGKARVLAQEILAGRLLVQTEDMRRVVIAGADVLTVLKRGTGGGKKKAVGKKAAAATLSSTGVSSTGVSSTGVSSTGVSSKGVASTEVASTEVSSLEVSSTDVASAERASAEMGESEDNPTAGPAERPTEKDAPASIKTVSPEKSSLDEDASAQDG